MNNFDNTGRKVCCKISLYKNCQGQSCSAINCLSSGINILAGGSSVPLISARKGTDPPLEALSFHTLRLIKRGSRPLASLACVRLTGWPVISTVGSIVGSTVKTMFTQFDGKCYFPSVWMEIKCYNLLFSVRENLVSLTFRPQKT